MEHAEGQFEGVGELQLYYQRWQPEAQPARAVVVVLHGDFAHSGWYLNLPNHVVPRGYAVYAFDRRGWGRSPGQRGYVSAWREYLDDLEAFLRLVQAEQPQRPIFLMGHTGSCSIVLEYAQQRPNEVQGVFCISPALNLGSQLSPALKGIVQVLSRLAPRLTINLKRQVDAVWEFVSHDQTFLETVGHDPLKNTRVTPRWLAESLAAMRRINPPRAAYAVPILFLIGEAGTLNDPATVRTFFQLLAAPDKELRAYPGAYVNLLSDTVQNEVLSDLDAWLRRHLGPNADGATRPPGRATTSDAQS